MLLWRSTSAGINLAFGDRFVVSSGNFDFCRISEFEFEKFDAVDVINIIHVDRFDIFSILLKDQGSQNSQDFSEETFRKAVFVYLAKLCFAVSTADSAATDARQLQQDRGEQVMSAVYILAMKVCQFHKDRVKQARCEFERAL